ncbi:quinone-dependent dihydroorotate dehydrogenase [Azospirillum doebereinerae]|uniref:Dihydroorotate dehydrogenase (quinone) n=1 Tax=Azospirillum doebereinerae TaxID=92933 RepID=A0A3S0WNC6_9PROT|nr:quinone-dependent dihydroorotate dehydrogenase [Azospirillum doebereinerae]MCG5242562.1 quinone-dependent dihydroorotate dehydrogenase [Azospirillum doebereinerae]RUQ74059.1 quinone-dependent dihydroorotate dehydrogenase [Azospirillum doebereinerae]
MIDLFPITAPLLFRFDPETAHGLTIKALKTGLVPAPRGRDEPSLRSRVWGLDFTNPVGLAAGFDKNAEVVDAMLRLGFGFVEPGSVTPRPQPGNPRPRLFRLVEQGAVINRMGFNNQGLDAFAERLERRRDNPRRAAGIVGANLGKNKDTVDAADDYVIGARRLAPLADYLVVNVSSPNTPGLRALQGRAPLRELLGRVLDARAACKLARNPPLLLKIAPDLTAEDKADIAAVALESGIDGLIVSNTTIARPAEIPEPLRAEAGGLSGRPLFGPSTAVLKEIYGLTGGKLPLVGAGGIASGADAYAKIRAGASLVQFYSAMVYGGPALVHRIRDELAGLLRRDGFESVAEAVGADHR